MEKLGLPPSVDPRENALRQYALDVTKKAEEMLGGDAMAVMKIAKALDWINREQEAAFNHNASVEECAKWIVKNLNDPRLKN